MAAHENIQPRKQAEVFQPPCESGRKRQGQEQEPQAKEGEKVSYSPYKPVRRKYGNRKVTIGGRTFDSKREAERYLELRSLMKSGHIYDLECQKRFELIPKQTDSEGKCIERKCEYIADFAYKTQSGETIVEDTKGFRTPEYIIKRKLMLYVHGIKVREI